MKKNETKVKNPQEKDCFSFIKTDSTHSLYDFGITFSTHERLKYWKEIDGTIPTRTIKSENDLKYFAHNDASHLVWSLGRKTENFLSCQLIVWDIDNAIDGEETTLKTAQEWMETHNFAGWIFTTKSHQKEKNGKAPRDKFRIAIPLSRPLNGAKEAGEVLTGLTGLGVATLPGTDPACKDLARYWSGSKDSQVFVRSLGHALDVDQTIAFIRSAKKQPGRRPIERGAPIEGNRNCNANKRMFGAYKRGGAEALAKEKEKLKGEIPGYGTPDFPSSELDAVEASVLKTLSPEQVKEILYLDFCGGDETMPEFCEFCSEVDRHYWLTQDREHAVGNRALNKKYLLDKHPEMMYCALSNRGLVNNIARRIYAPGLPMLPRDGTGWICRNTYSPPQRYADEALLEKYWEEDMHTMRVLATAPISTTYFSSDLRCEITPTEEHHRDYILQHAKWLLQNPGKTLDRHPVVCGPIGCGKSFWFESILSRIIGPQNHTQTSVKKMFSVDGRFDSIEVTRKVLILIEEAKFTQDEMKVFESIGKNKRLEVEEKYQSKRSAERVANFAFLSNPNTNSLKYLIEDRSTKVMYWEDPDFIQGSEPYEMAQYFYSSFFERILMNGEHPDREQIFVENARRFLEAIDENYALLRTPTLASIVELARQDSISIEEEILVEWLQSLRWKSEGWKSTDIKDQLSKDANNWSNTKAQAAEKYFDKCGSQKRSECFKRAGFARIHTRCGKIWKRNVS